jgi:hypothetical protein
MIRNGKFKGCLSAVIRFIGGEGGCGGEYGGIGKMTSGLGYHMGNGNAANRCGCSN